MAVPSSTAMPRAPHERVEVPDQLPELGVVGADGVEKARQACEQDVDHLLAVSEVVGDDRSLATRLDTVPDSPWNTWMIEPASWLTWSGARAEKSGWKPSNTAVRSIAGVVREIGMTAARLQRLAAGLARQMARKR